MPIENMIIEIGAKAYSVAKVANVDTDIVCKR